MQFIAPEFTPLNMSIFVADPQVRFVQGSSLTVNLAASTAAVTVALAQATSGGVFSFFQFAEFFEFVAFSPLDAAKSPLSLLAPERV